MSCNSVPCWQWTLLQALSSKQAHSHWKVLVFVEACCHQATEINYANILFERFGTDGKISGDI